MGQQFFAAYHRDELIVKNSSSGGAFSAITDAWFSKYGDKACVFGCVLDEKLKARHIRATTSAERDKMRGSKYISSDTREIFSMAKTDLLEGRYICFSGTPCQVAALKSFLKLQNIDYDGRLLTVEVICHGVGSNRFFSDYISHLEKKNKSTAVQCRFRAKSRPDKVQDMEVVFENGRRYNAASIKYDWFYSVYLKNYILRPSCYNCRFAKPEREADISIADHWKQNEVVLNATKSLILANTPLGCRWAETALKSMDYECITQDEVRQPHMHAPCSAPASYDEFWAVYKQSGYLAAQKYLGNNSFKRRVAGAAASVLNKLHLIALIKRLKRLIK